MIDLRSHSHLAEDFLGDTGNELDPGWYRRDNARPLVRPASGWNCANTRKGTVSPIHVPDNGHLHRACTDLMCTGRGRGQWALRSHGLRLDATAW